MEVHTCIGGNQYQVFSKTFDFSVYLWAALIYLCITALFVLLWRQAERRLSRHIDAPHKTRSAAQPLKETRA